ncbi:MAG TPA: sialidase family protein [Terriglobales bacterium]|nr:sialidase family protein [Terriglobales bacterium]
MRFRILATLTLVSLVTSMGCGGSGSKTHSPQSTPPPTLVPLTQLSSDTFTNSTSQHETEVEAHAWSNGSTIVSAFQVARIFGGGGADIGFATSTNGGASWSNGVLPGITTFDGGVYSAVSDPAVAYDAAHSVWMISTLPINSQTDKVAVSVSSDGMNWGNPTIVSTTPDADKNWVACDSTPTSPFFGHCYVEWDDPSNGGMIWMSTSTDGGLTWGTARSTLNLASGIGGQPVVEPGGKVIVPIENFDGMSMIAFSSSDGGSTWGAATLAATITDHLVAGNLRTSPLPAAAVDAGGTAYLVWQDCRFRTGCASNDLVLSTSSDGVTWTVPARVPIDAVTSTADYFIPGLAVEPGTSGSTAHLGLMYYFYPAANCTTVTCALNAGFISSLDGGSTWSLPTTMAGPMTPTWLPNTFAGLMVGDYSSVAFSGGKAFPVFPVAGSNSGTLFNEPTFATSSGFAMRESAAVLTSEGEHPVPGAHSDHPPRRFYDQEHRHPIRPPERE